MQEIYNTLLHIQAKLNHKSPLLVFTKNLQKKKKHSIKNSRLRKLVAIL